MALPPTSLHIGLNYSFSKTLPTLLSAGPTLTRPCPHLYLPTLPSHRDPTTTSPPLLSELIRPVPTLWPHPLSHQPLTQSLEQQCAVQSEDKRRQVLQAHHGHVAVDPNHLMGEAVGAVEGVVFPGQRPCNQDPSAPALGPSHQGPSHPGCTPAAGFRGPQYGQPPCEAAPLEPWPGTGRPAGVAGSLPAARGTAIPAPRGAESRKSLPMVYKSEAGREFG